MLGPTAEPQASALASSGLGVVDSDLYLVLTSWLPGLRPQASFSGAHLVHFHVNTVFSESTFTCVQCPFLSAQCLC